MPAPPYSGPFLVLLLCCWVICSVLWIVVQTRFSKFGTDGGSAAKALKPKFSVLTKRISSDLGFSLHHIEMMHVIAATIALKGLGGLLFIFSSTLGAYFLMVYLPFITPVVYDFYNYDIKRSEFIQLFIKYIQNLALFGSLLFFLGMKNSIPRRPA